MKNTGIWMDQDRAFIINLESGEETSKTIFSELEHFRIHGGSGTRFKGGPQDVVQDSRYLERQKHQLRSYFKNLIPEIKESNNLVLFGPADTVQKFAKELESNYREICERLLSVHKADSMTENQMKAWVRNFYNQFS